MALYVSSGFIFYDHTKDDFLLFYVFDLLFGFSVTSISFFLRYFQLNEWMMLWGPKRSWSIVFTLQYNSLKKKGKMCMYHCAKIERNMPFMNAVRASVWLNWWIEAVTWGRSNCVCTATVYDLFFFYIHTSNYVPVIKHLAVFLSHKTAHVHLEAIWIIHNF